MDKSTLSKGFAWGALLVLGMAGPSANADSLANTEWSLTGKLTGTASVKCAVGGSRRVPFKARRNIQAVLSFQDNGKFIWSGDTMSLPVPLQGSYTQSGKKVNLDFDDPVKASAIHALGNQLIAAQAGGAEYSPSKYDFSAQIKSKGKRLEVTEIGGFKVKAQASAFGSSNSCQYNIRLERNYKATPR